jgi:hypothetical protein
MKDLLVLPACALGLLMAGCSERPSTNAKTAEKVEPVTGQSALFKMYQVARTWAPDAEVITMKSIHLTDVPAVRGQAGAWEAIFYSPAKSAQRNYTYSVEEGEANLHKGVFPGQQQSASGASLKPFLIGAVRIDSDAAYKTAAAHAAEYDKKNPSQTISFELGRQDVSQNPVWRVIWGESAGTSGESVLVDAKMGEYLKTLH